MQCVKLRAKGCLSYGCVFIIAPLRSVTVRFVLRELSIFLLCLDYVLWPGAASRPSAVSKFCGNLRQWAGKTAVSILILWISSVADSLEMKEMSSRYHFNKRALFSNYKPMLRIENPAIQLAPWFWLRLRFRSMVGLSLTLCSCARLKTKPRIKPFRILAPAFN